MVSLRTSWDYTSVTVRHTPKHTPSLIVTQQQSDNDRVLTQRGKAKWRREMVKVKEEKWLIGIHIKGKPREGDISNWQSSKKWRRVYDFWLCAKETDTTRKSSSQVMKLNTHQILTISHIQHLCLYLIIFQRLSVDAGKMIRLIIFCWFCV